MGAFRGKRILLTGHTGFKGAWLALALQRLGAEVTGFALDPATTPNLWTLLNLDLRDLRGDLREPEAVTRAFEVAKPDLVLHLAAQALVLPSLEDPSGTFASNVQGTVHLLEAARRCSTVKAVLVVTSDKVYRNEEHGRPFVEDDALGGHDPYSASKACVELVVDCWRSRWFGPEGRGLATARAGNVIGGGDWAAHRLVPDLLRSLSQGEALELRHPSARRPWQHVLEPLSGYLRLAAQLMEDPVKAASAWNFGPSADAAWTVAEVTEALMSAWDRRVEVRLGAAVAEAQLLRLDATKAVGLGWSPRWGTDEALRRTVAWEKGRLEGGSAKVLCDADLSAHGGFDAL